MGSSTVDLMVAAGVVDTHARDRKAGIAAAENAVLAAPYWNDRMDPNLWPSIPRGSNRHFVTGGPVARRRVPHKTEAEYFR